MASLKLADRLYELRTKQRIHQNVLAAAIGVNPPMYSRIEKGERRPKPEYLDILSDIFGLDKSELRMLLIADRIHDVISGESQDIVKMAVTMVNDEI